MSNLGKWYVGVDPGSTNGGIAAIQGTEVRLHELPAAGEWEDLTWDFLITLGLPVSAVIEQQTARPTFVPSLGKPTILASTCYLYGSYTSLKTMLMCASIPYTDCPPKQWQEGLGVPKKVKGTSDTTWKNQLKAFAQNMFPDARVTLWNADALLMAAYCMILENNRVPA